MASASDIAEVRSNTGVPVEDYSDEKINEYVDVRGVAGASQKIWEELAVGYAMLVDVSEAGASRKLSDLHRNALAMADRFAAQVPGGGVENEGRPKVKKIVRQ